MADLIRISNLTVAYDRHPALHHLSGSFQRGSLTALIGPNGAGKSTLVKTIAGLLKPDDGEIIFDNLKKQDIAYLPQSSAIDETFPITVHDVVCMGLWRHIGAFRAVTDEMRHFVEDALHRVGLMGFEDRIYGELSAGQRQRVLFARVMVADAQLILLDEPFSAMDARTVKHLLTLIAKWHAEGRTQIVVLHDFSLVRQHFPQSLLLARYKIAWGDTNQILTEANLEKSRQMSEAWSDETEFCEDGHLHDEAAS